MPVSSEDSRAERVLGTLETAIAEERLPHGVLLHGNHLGHLEKSCLRLTRQLLGIEEAKRQHPDLHELRFSSAANSASIDQLVARIVPFDDIEQLVHLTLGMAEDGLPAIQLIVGEQDLHLLQGEVR